MENKYKYEWRLSETTFSKHKGKVFSCFAGGGGSSIGYKLSGFDVIGALEIDKRMAETYKENLNPKYLFTESIRDFINRDDIPEDLYSLDILDGSPPCSSFSMSGSREKGWGKKKKFREGQKEQVIDTLFFDFIDLAKKLQPKIVVAENVKGLLMGRAKKYVERIIREFHNAGYYLTSHLLNAKHMGVPQSRERVFFIAVRNDITKFISLREYNLFGSFPKINLSFSEDEILFKEIKDEQGSKIRDSRFKIWKERKDTDAALSDTLVRLKKKRKYFNSQYIYDNKVPCTLIAKREILILFNKPIFLSPMEIKKISSFPLDYKCKNINYVCGMSVPPVMMARIADRIYQYYLSDINGK